MDSDHKLKILMPDESMITTPSNHYDSPWKEALEKRFAEFLALLFPEIYRDVDWSRPLEFLDTELQQVVQDAQVGRRYADKLVRLWTRDDREVCVLAHVEVQGDPDSGFSRRMCVYNFRITEWRDVDVVSLGVLADASPRFRPTSYQRKRWGCELEFRFPVVKLLDWENRWDELEHSDNVFSLVVMAQIKAKRCKDVHELRAWKLRLIRLMYERGYTRAMILEFFRIIDWMIRLPEGLERQFLADVYKIEEEKKMSYITSAERFGIEKGIQQGTYATLRTLILNAQNKGLGDDLIAGITGLDVSSVRRILNNEPVDLPQGLLCPGDASGSDAVAGRG